MTRTLITTAALLTVLATPAFVAAKQAPPQGPPPPQFVSPEVLPDQRVAFRVYAPQARAIRLAAGDIPGVGRETQLVKGEQDVWEIKLGPIDSGAYRYNFNIDGVATIDPRNPAISESNNNVWSLVYVPGSDKFDTKPVARGAVAEVTYQSTALGKYRRMQSTRLPATKRAAAGIRSSTCCTAPVITTIRGRRSAAPASSSTT